MGAVAARFVPLTLSLILRSIHTMAKSNRWPENIAAYTYGALGTLAFRNCNTHWPP